MVIYTRGVPGERPHVDGYNGPAESVISFGEKHLAVLAAKPSPEGYRRVMEQIISVESQRMTPYQQARVLSLKAETTYFLDDWEGALRIAREASLLANTMPEDEWRKGDIARVQGEIYRRIAEIQRRRGDLHGAAETYGHSVGRLWHAAIKDGWVSTHSLRDSLARCVGMSLVWGDEDRARTYLDMAMKARQLTRIDEQKPTEDSVIDWMRALILQRDGRLMEAMDAAMKAADGFMAAGPDASAVRILWITVGIQLDLAESHKEGSSSRKDFLRMALGYHGMLMKHARQGKDSAGLAMGSLLCARLYRLTRPGYRMGVMRIKRVLEKRIREQAWDWPTITDGRMVLAREMLVRAERLESAGGAQREQLARTVREEARAELEQAIATAEAERSPGFTWWAERTLGALPAPR